nr:segregation/condensation protein A [Cohnella lubricantis]
MDLLLHLIDKAEIDIQDISISEITDQYIEYLAAMQQLELDVTSEFLVMAATLLSMKSRQLLPKPPVTDEPWVSFDEEEGEDPREELIRKLIEYRKFKAIASQLREQEYERSLVFTRDPADLSPFVPEVKKDSLPPGLHVDDLVRAFSKAMRRVAGRNRIAAIQRDEISIKDRIREIVDALKAKAEFGEGQVLFSQLIGEQMDRQEVVVTFLAILELMKRRIIACYQNQLFDEIVLTWTGKEDAEDGLFEIEIDT